MCRASLAPPLVYCNVNNINLKGQAILGKQQQEQYQNENLQRQHKNQEHQLSHEQGNKENNAVRPKLSSILRHNKRMESKSIEIKKDTANSVRTNSTASNSSTETTADFSITKNTADFIKWCFADVPELMKLDKDEDSSMWSNASCSIGTSSSSESLASSSSTFKPEAKKVCFSHDVTIQEFSRFPCENDSTWYRFEDFEFFKHTVMEAVSDYNAKCRHQQQSRGAHNPGFFAHPALNYDSIDVVKEQEVWMKGEVLRKEIRNVLIVDPHDLSCLLFAKLFKNMWPHASITTAKSSDDALRKCYRMKHQQQQQQEQLNGCESFNDALFDVILVEERLHLFHRSMPAATAVKHYGDSGSALVRAIRQLNGSSLFIGVSSHLDEDRELLETSGVDHCWTKPTPAFDASLSDDLLQSLLVKRAADSDNTV